MEGDKGPKACSRANFGQCDGARGSRKRLQRVRGSDFSRGGTSCKGDKADDELASLLGDGFNNEDVKVDKLGRSIDEEVERFHKEPLEKKNFPLITFAQFWRDWGAEALHPHVPHCSVSNRSSGFLRTD